MSQSISLVYTLTPEGESVEGCESVLGGFDSLFLFVAI